MKSLSVFVFSLFLSLPAAMVPAMGLILSNFVFPNFPETEGTATTSTNTTRDVFQCNKLPTSETLNPQTLHPKTWCSWIIHLLRVIDFVRSLPELRRRQHRGCVGCQVFGASRPLDVFFWNWPEHHQKDVSIEHLPFQNLKRHIWFCISGHQQSGKFFAPSTVKATSG